MPNLTFQKTTSMTKRYGTIFFVGISLLGLSQNPIAIPTALTGTTFDLTLQNGTAQFFSGTATNTMGVNGSLLGPTLIMNEGDNVTINVTNNLGEASTIHWHGMHVPAIADGGPHTEIPDNTTWSPAFMVRNFASTNWYHPHLHMNTNKHVQKGIAGMIIVRDAEEAALSLPRTYGEDDFPIVVQTKGFDVNNQIIIETALDTTLLVNGTKDPYLDAPAQWVRLRLLNGSSERYYNFGFSGNLPFKQIATDGGLLTAPVDLTRVMVAPGERAEIVIDLSALQGNTIQLMSYGAELASGIYGAAQPGMGAGQTIPNYALNPLNGANFTVMDINVVAPNANPVTSISAALTTHTPWLEANADALKTLTFTPQTMGPTAIEGPFLINNTMFDMDVINYQIPLDNIEVWTLSNQSPIGHPFHIHDISFYILDINGTPPPPNMQGRKDVVHVPAGMGTVRFITKFENYANDTLPYMYHCHILTHEDMGMMGQFIVYDPLGIKEVQTNYKLYPNPSNTSLFFESAFSNETYILTDQFGRKVFEGNLMSGSLHIDIGQISKGIYLLSIPEKQIHSRFIRN